MIVWNRQGIVVLLAWVVALFMTDQIFDAWGVPSYRETPEKVAMSFLLAACINFAVVQVLRRFEKEDGQLFFFIPISHWTYIAIVFAVVYYAIFGIFYAE